MGRARAKLYGIRDLGAAATHIEEALRLSANIEDRSYLFDALDCTAQIQISRGELIAAADTLIRAFTVVADIDDHALLYFGCLDRAEVYQKIAEKCDYERTFEPCYEAMELSKAQTIPRPSTSQESLDTMVWPGKQKASSIGSSCVAH